ncbi:hypothetical protein BN938_2348 [Mucinivorans hirudinis]|uniref:Uncharacterized protein n=1 Tax=Mucinivorans hirudinis TaxID=1433126 RepID=A0A060RE67_9BACT|nr:hypothetical protein BN938_2348 [Mucinivorans hirudinis]
MYTKTGAKKQDIADNAVNINVFMAIIMYPSLCILIKLYFFIIQI